MGSKWVTTTLGDIALGRDGAVDGPFGSNLPASCYQDVGIPVVRGSNLSVGLGEFKDDGFVYVSDSTFDKLSRSECKVGDIVFTKKGTLGQTGLITSEHKFDRYLLSSNQMRLRVDPTKAISEYVYFCVSSKKTILKLIKDSESTGVPKINLAYLKSIQIELPSIEIQKEIIGHLGALNSKITLNNQINQTLEQMAQTLFKSWFVDFDPVKAKMNGEQPKGMDAVTAALFPEKLVESELGLIPEGWEIHKTQDLFDVKDGTHDSPKKAEEGHYLVTSKHITKGKIDTSSAYQISDADFEKVNQRSKVDTFDILLTMIGTVGEVVVVYDNPVEFAIKNVGLFKTSQKPELVWLFYWHLQSFKMKHYLEARMAGTTQQYLTLKTLRTIPVVLPSDELLAKFNEVMSPLMEKISDNHKQSHTLSNLRDTLLPKLLSGEIDLENLQVEQANALAE
ncbi:restriction endonuclease subunit S [Vibrio kanaloae]|uniref:restriction endonuclease subunit S n=1 Tax=Vibrio kanaloae TaxID=170673 RepID=UPI001EFC31B4|nr:restriction endonuclease subunit S [Vibrio kanaloae]MCG9558000.1 restriction endonuclease subunit S [Vibrio kanaloae]